MSRWSLGRERWVHRVMVGKDSLVLLVPPLQGGLQNVDGCLIKINLQISNDESHIWVRI